MLQSVGIVIVSDTDIMMIHTQAVNELEPQKWEDNERVREDEKYTVGA